MSDRSTRVILRSVLNFHLYKIQILQQLNGNDKEMICLF
jgi:hypothetical protein